MSAITLWEHQELGVNQVAQLAGNGTRRIVFQLATGGGKTVAFSALTQRFRKRIPKRVVIAVHRDRLAHQTVEALKEVAGIEAGYLIAGYKNIVRRMDDDIYIPYNSAPVVVCMVETLNNRFKRYGKYLGEIGLLIVDECHRGEFHKIYSHFPKALTVGFSATPISSKKKFPMNMFFDEIVCPGSIRELIKKKKLSQNITIGDKNGINRKKMKVTGGEFNNKDMSQIFTTSKHVTNTVDAYEKYAIRDKTMVYNCNIEHSKLVMQEFVDRGYNARHLDGKASTEERHDTLLWLRDTPDAILCSIELLTTGFDEPTIETVIINRATMSLVLWVQMCLDLDTEILTSHGWRKHDKVNNKDIVASFNKADSTIEFSECSDKVFRPLYAETMYSLQSPFIDIRVTGQHTLVHRGRTKGRVDMPVWKMSDARDVAPIKSTYEIPIAGYTNNPDNTELSDHDLRFLGWVLSDGGIDISNNSIRISQAVSQPQKHHDSIIESIRGCNFKYSTYRIKRTGHLKRYSDIIQYRVSYGKPRGTAKHLTGWGRLEPYIDKNISNALMTISRRQLMVLLETIWLGDGRKEKTAYWTPRSMSITAGDNRIYADRLQILCITNGLKCNISTHDYNQSPLYNLQIKDRNYASIKGCNEQDGNRLLPEATSTQEKVWCVKTKHGTLITRRNGKVAIMGNCGRGSRVCADIGKFTFKIIDLGNNVNSHLDWDYPHDWEYYFHHPEAASNGKGVAPTKTCPNKDCEAIIHLSTRICPFCGKDISKPTVYDKESLDLSVLTRGVDVAKLIEKNKKYKTYASLHIAKRQLVGRFRSRYKYNECPMSVRDMLDQRWQTIVKQWCQQHEKRHDKWHKDTTRKWLMDELDRYYGRIILTTEA